MPLSDMPIGIPQGLFNAVEAKAAKPQQNQSAWLFEQRPRIKNQQYESINQCSSHKDVCRRLPLPDGPAILFGYRHGTIGH
jgi:hypothetical protein